MTANTILSQTGNPRQVVTGPQATARPQEKQLWDQCAKFEAVFMNMMLSQMRKTVQSDGGVLPESHGQKMMRDQLDTFLADEMSRRGVSGIAGSLFGALDKHIVRPETDPRLRGDGEPALNVTV
jgi:Rod binding domain-containing protein